MKTAKAIKIIDTPHPPSAPSPARRERKRNSPPITHLQWEHQYRIIPTKFPPITIFHDLADLDQLDILFELESMTNDRLSAEAHSKSTEDYVGGPGSSIVMAAFIHFSPNKPSRFSDGSYGIYYASKIIETAIRETVFHREKFLSYTNQEACSLDMRVYVGKVLKPLHDIRSSHYAFLHSPEDYSLSQLFAKALREKESYGIVYNSTRHDGGECIAALRPTAISIPKQTKTLTYVWNGQRITDVYEKSKVLYQF